MTYEFNSISSTQRSGKLNLTDEDSPEKLFNIQQEAERFATLANKLAKSIQGESIGENPFVLEGQVINSHRDLEIAWQAMFKSVMRPRGDITKEAKKKKKRKDEV